MLLVRNVWKGYKSRRLPNEIQDRAMLKLRQIASATTMDDLRVPNSNYLEPLKGNRKGQWSIRINQQWRICFKWNGTEVSDVEIVDYH